MAAVEISFARTTVVVWFASDLWVSCHCGCFGSGGPGKTRGATWALCGLSPGRDQPFETVSQQPRPIMVLPCWVAWGEHIWRALAKYELEAVTMVVARGCLPRGSMSIVVNSTRHVPLCVVVQVGVVVQLKACFSM